MKSTWLVLLAVFLLGCGPEPAPTVVPPDTSGVVGTVVASHNMTRTAEAARAPTATHTPTDTATPTATATPTDTATPTPPPVAQLEGQVLDEGSGQPVVGAQVVAGERQTTTDTEGRFLFADLSPGPYTVLIKAADHDPVLSGIVDLRAGEQVVVDAALPAAGAGVFPRDPMASNQIDPAGAPTAQEAERLARLQGLQGEVVSIREVVLEGEYLVNYKKGDAIRAAMAKLHHPAWQLVDEAGQAWYIIRVCGNLAVVRAPKLEVPSQCVAQPNPVVTVGGGGAVGRACPEEGCDAVVELPAGWHGVALGCSAGCEWLRLQGPGMAGTCWVRAELVQLYGELASLPLAVAAESEPTPTLSPSSVPEIRWSEPELIGGAGQGGPTQQLLLDQQGRLWAFWEEHVAWQPPDRGYDSVHYRVWDGNAWSDLHDIPGSDNYGEPTATLLPDGRILVKAETTTPRPYLWVQWDGSRWSPVLEMATLEPLNEGIRGIAADTHGFVHVLGYPIRTWDGRSWQEREKLGNILYHATALDAEGALHAVGTAVPPGSAWGIREWTWNGQSWSVLADIYTPSAQSDTSIGAPSLAIGPEGISHVVWTECDPLPVFSGRAPPVPCWIRYSRGHNHQWSRPETIFGPITVELGRWDPNLAVAPDGTVIVVWGDVKLGAGYRAYVRWGRDDKWIEPMVLSPEDGDEHMWPVVALDAAGRVHVLWKARAGVYHVMGTVMN